METSRNNKDKETILNHERKRFNDILSQIESLVKRIGGAEDISKVIHKMSRFENKKLGSTINGIELLISRRWKDLKKEHHSFFHKAYLCAILLFFSACVKKDNDVDYLDKTKRINVTGRVFGELLMNEFNFAGFLSPEKDSVFIRDQKFPFERGLIVRDSKGIALIGFNYEAKPQWEIQKEKFTEKNENGKFIQMKGQQFAWYISNVTGTNLKSSYVSIDTIYQINNFSGEKDLDISYVVISRAISKEDSLNLEFARNMLEKIRSGVSPTSLEMYGLTRACMGHSAQKEIKKTIYKEGDNYRY